MSAPDTRRRTRATRRQDTLIGYLGPVTIVGLAIADFVKDGEINKYLLGSLLLLSLAALGYRVDTWVEAYIVSRAPGYEPPQPNNQEGPGNANASTGPQEGA